MSKPSRPMEGEDMTVLNEPLLLVAVIGAGIVFAMLALACLLILIKIIRWKP